MYGYIKTALKKTSPRCKDFFPPKYLSKGQKIKKKATLCFLSTLFSSLELFPVFPIFWGGSFGVIFGPLGVVKYKWISMYKSKLVIKCASVVFHWLRNERSRKLFLTQGWESGYRCMWGFRSHGFCKGFSFCFAICHCLTCPTHPPSTHLWSTCRIWWGKIIL